MPRLSHSDALLAETMRELKRRWEGTSSGWRDKAREAFGKEYIDDVIPAVKMSINAAGKINQILGRAIRECS